MIAFHTTLALTFDLKEILLVVGNTFLLAFTAAGAQQTIANAATAPKGIQQGAKV